MNLIAGFRMLLRRWGLGVGFDLSLAEYHSLDAVDISATNVSATWFLCHAYAEFHPMDIVYMILMM